MVQNNAKEVTLVYIFLNLRVKEATTPMEFMNKKFQSKKLKAERVLHLHWQIKDLSLVGISSF